MEPKGSSRLHGTLWIRPHWPACPLLPQFPFLRPWNLHQHPGCPSKHCQYCVLLYWPPPHTCLTLHTCLSSLPAGTTYLESVLPFSPPSAGWVQILPRTPTPLGQELQKHEAHLALVSLPADCSLATEAGCWDHRHPLGGWNFWLTLTSCTSVCACY